MELVHPHSHFVHSFAGIFVEQVFSMGHGGHVQIANHHPAPFFLARFTPVGPLAAIWAMRAASVLAKGNYNTGEPRFTRAGLPFFALCHCGSTWSSSPFLPHRGVVAQSTLLDHRVAQGVHEPPPNWPGPWLAMRNERRLPRYSPYLKHRTSHPPGSSDGNSEAHTE